MDGRGSGELIPVGKVSKAHGIRGEIKIYPYSGDPEQFSSSYQRIFLSGDKDRMPVSYDVERSRVQGRQVLLKLENCSTRTEAESLTGQQVYVPVNDLPKLGENEFYLHELEGRQLVDTAGTLLGYATRVIETSGHDLLVVQQEGKEYLVPVVGDFIVNIEKDRVVLDLPPGLLEINE